MRIAIATPLYPPDTAPAALYAKELAERLSNSHTVSLVVYGHLPEPIEGVHIVSIKKRLPLPLRLLAYTSSLLTETRRTDVLYVINGASVELPLLLVSRLSRTPFIFIAADADAFARADNSRALRFLQRKAMRRSSAFIETLPMPRPEILPLEARPVEALATYERSWQEHLALLTTTYGK